jgi:predicted kinase
MTTKTLCITRGIPGSGKTTFAKALVAQQSKTVRVNRDDIRIEQMGITTGVGTHDQERLVTEIQLTTVRKYLRWDYNVIVDDTNLKLSVARDWADVAVECGAQFFVKDFTYVPLDLCIVRALTRAANGGRSVPAEVIENMHRRYLAAGPLPIVFPTVKAESLITQYVPDFTKPTAYIFDIDGTLAEMSGRSPYDWQRIHEDTVKEDVRGLLWNLHDSFNEIIIVSGRDGACYDTTEKWLKDNEIDYTALFMRPAGDNRKDSLIKSEIFWRDIAPHYYVVGVVDDRNSVVDMWRSIGLTCFQCAPGSF